jgi:3-hydroxyisobutyrate dehydrogenase
MTLIFGVVGLGNMGSLIAARLDHAGLLGLAFDIDPSRCAPFGAAAAASVEQLVDDVDVVVTLLPTSEAIHSLLLSDRSVLAHWSAGKILIDMGTTEPSVSIEVADAVARAGGRYIEAPVSGGTAAARSGALTVIAAGDRSAIADVRPLLDVVASEVSFVGAPGSAQLLKLANNMLLAVQTVAVGEAWRLVRASGLDPATAHEILTKCSGDSRVLRTRTPQPGLVPGSPPSDGFRPGFPVRLMLKDIDLALAAAGRAGASMTILEAARARYAAAAEHGHSEFDISIVGYSMGGDDG